MRPAILAGSRGVRLAPFNIVGFSGLRSLLTALHGSQQQYESTFPQNCPVSLRFPCFLVASPVMHDLWARPRILPRDSQGQVCTAHWLYD